MLRARLVFRFSRIALQAFRLFLSMDVHPRLGRGLLGCSLIFWSVAGLYSDISDLTVARSMLTLLNAFVGVLILVRKPTKQVYSGHSRLSASVDVAQSISGRFFDRVDLGCLDIRLLRAQFCDFPLEAGYHI
jgi:hypothetical protein